MTVEPAAVPPTDALGGDGSKDLDVRTLPHSTRHSTIFGRLDELAAGETFVIRNDHDPKPLRFQTDAQWPGAFAWTYLEAGPEQWRVAVTRVG